MPIIHSDQSSGSGVHVKWPRVSGFTLLEPLYEGSSSALYRARQDRLGRVVALKLLPEWPPPTDVALERFNRAAYVYAQTQHPQLVTLYETGTKDGYHYLTLEYIAGQTLQKHLTQLGNSDERFALHVAENVLKALVALHGRDICHRNLKPKNIFIESNGNVRVLGLGLASCKSAFFSPHLDARPIGTPHFMAPEMIRGSYSDPRSDLYSLGVTLYVMTTGRPPFEGSPLAVMSRHLTDSPAPMTEMRADLSREFIQFVHTLMAREPEQRFQTARDALEHCQALARRHDSPPRLIPEMLFGAPKLNGVQIAGVPLQSRLRKLLGPAALVAGSALLTLLLLAGILQVSNWYNGYRENRAPAPAAATPVVSEEETEFFRLIENNPAFIEDPAAGAAAWASYLEKYPQASPIHRSRAQARLEAMLRKPTPEPRRENPEF